jgi:hypothetical protein
LILSSQLAGAVWKAVCASPCCSSALKESCGVAPLHQQIKPDGDEAVDESHKQAVCKKKL